MLMHNGTGRLEYFIRGRVEHGLSLSDFTTDSAPLFIAVQLVRLRDRARGSVKLDYSGWFGPMEGPERDLRELAGNLARGKRRSGGRQKAAEFESIRWRVAYLDRDFSLWRGIFADEAAMVAKFLKLLADLRLNVSPELEELKSLNQRNDYALGRTEGFINRLTAAASGERTEGFEDEFPIYRELLSIAESLEKLKARVDEKAEDAIRLVSLMTTSVDSESLMDLMTGEP